LGIVFDEPPAMTELFSGFATPLQYARLYSDAEGVSHFATEEFELVSGRDQTQGPLPSLPIPNVQGATYVALKGGGAERWHTAPRRQFIICLTGEAEFEAGSGEVRRLKPGGVLLVEDTTGKGHITRVVSSVDHVAIVVPAPAAR
jgi:quercetin dioxygenase-like cupin family protein